MYAIESAPKDTKITERLVGNVAYEGGMKNVRKNVTQIL
jgi:hypothetical protein